jgi:hypothetical protein
MMMLSKNLRSVSIIEQAETHVESGAKLFRMSAEPEQNSLFDVTSSIAEATEHRNVGYLDYQKLIRLLMGHWPARISSPKCCDFV